MFKKRSNDATTADMLARAAQHAESVGVDGRTLPNPPDNDQLVEQAHQLREAIYHPPQPGIAMVGIPATHMLVLVEELLVRRGSTDANLFPFDQDAANVVQGKFPGYL